MIEYVRSFDQMRSTDTALFGGKNASLGEMIQTLSKKGVNVPKGFATSSGAYWDFLKASALYTHISDALNAWKKGEVSLEKTGKTIRKMILKEKFSPEFERAIVNCYRNLGLKKVAVRSSATAEDLPTASFAGQQESYLNVRGKRALLTACKKCIASLFTNRAISYRDIHGFNHMKVALSIGVQQMVEADRACSGIMFSIDTESGFPDVVLIDASWGLGELIVQGSIDPDEYLVYKPKRTILEKRCGGKEKKLVGKRKLSTTKHEREQIVLQDKEILQLADWACLIEQHYGMPMDMEWAKDHKTGQLYIVQARPETVHSHAKNTLKSYQIESAGKCLIEGLSIGQSIGCGRIRKLKSPKEINSFNDGDVLVTKMTTPDWVPLMKKAAAIVTDHGGRTSHAAIVSRELGLPAVVGTGDATRKLKEAMIVTIDCSEGETGYVYEGEAKYTIDEIDLSKLPETKTDVMLNIGDPSSALSWWQLPAKGVGLARVEFLISNTIKIHPMALVHYKQLKAPKLKRQITALTVGYKDKKEFFIDKMSSGIAKIAAVHYPNPVIVRLSDFKTNEYADLIGGELYEPKEENPMLGWRGASRYYHPNYEEGFALECAALKRVREKMRFENVKVMLPFCRTLSEADQVIKTMKKYGLKRGENGLELYVMCEIPSNVIMAEEYAKRFDGFSIGSNDLTQLVLGVDRDSDRISALFDEKDPAVKKMIEEVIRIAKDKGIKVGICGQAPSDHPDYARFLVKAGINSISVTPDSFASLIRVIAEEES